MDNNRKGNTNILMLPWLAHGHISPFLELAKKLTHRNFTIYLCSTPINLNSIKNSIIHHNYSASIKLIELNLPSSPQLPPHYHTTNGLPPNLMNTLKDTFELSSPAFSNILTTIKPDLLLYDFNQPWAATIASSHKIPAVQFITGGASMTAYALHMINKPGQGFPFPLLMPSHNKISEVVVDFTTIPEDLKKDIARFLEALHRSQDIILSKTFREIEGKYIDYLSVLTNKKIVLVGPLVQESNKDDDVDDQHKQIIEWLDKKEKSSVVFVSFGSEYFLSNEEMEEVAYGLELSEVNFIWVVRFPVGESTNNKLKEALPKDYVERVGDRGMVVEGWAPQAKILGHSSTGGFVSHCGWSSVMESMKFGVPIIGIPMQLDQPLNARLVEEIGVGVEVVRDEGRLVLRKEVIAEVIKKVVVEESGEAVRRKARELSEIIDVKGDDEIDLAAKELVQLCTNNT